MRTALDIDDDLLQAAKELAQYEDKTAGQVLSDLARRGILCKNTHDQEESQEEPFIIKDGLPVLRSRGRIVTNEMVRKLQEELDLEEARRKGGY